MRPAVGVAKCVPRTSTSRSACSRRKRIAGRERLLGIGVEARLDARIAALDRVVHEIAGDHRLGAARTDAHADVPRRVPGRRLEADLVGDRVVARDPVDQAGVDAPGAPNRPCTLARVSRRRPRPVRRTRCGRRGSARAETSAPSGRRRGACSSRRGRRAGACTARCRSTRAGSRPPRSRSRNGPAAAWSRPAASRALSLPTQVSTTIVLPRDSTTKAWIDATRRPSAVAKCGRSHAFDCTGLGAQVREQERRRHAGEERDDAPPDSTIRVTVTSPTRQRSGALIGMPRCFSLRCSRGRRLMAAPAGRRAPRAPRRRRGRPARRDGSRRSPCRRRRARARSARARRRCASPPSAPARRRGDARRRPSRGAAARAGAGSGASAAAARRRRGARRPRPSSQSASAARSRTARRVGTWSMTSLTPVMTTATSAANGAALDAAGRGRRASSGRCARARPSAIGRPVARCSGAHEVADDAPAPGARRRRRRPTNRRRRAGAAAARRQRRATPSRAPCGLGQHRRAAPRRDRLRDEQRRERELERERRQRMAGAHARQNLREVGLALLEEGTERFLRLGALQARAEDLALDARSSRAARSRAVAAQQPLGLAHRARRQGVEALGDAARVRAPPRPPAAPRWRCRTRPRRRR